MRSDLSAAEARRLALSAQGLGGARPAKPTAAALKKAAATVHSLQYDAVNVLIPAHHLPLFSRVGAYPLTTLERLVNVEHALVEGWSHQASLTPPALEPLLRWRQLDPSARWRGAVDPGYVEAILAEVTALGPVGLSDLADPGRRPKPAHGTLLRKDGQPYSEASVAWHRPSVGKAVLDGLVQEGVLALAGRRGVERLYDRRERVLPPEVLAAPTPTEPEARRALVLLAAQALGVATVADLAGYFHHKIGPTKQAIASLVEAGELEQVTVEGWPLPAFKVPGIRIPRVVSAATLLGPFDSLTWNRERVLRLFDFEFSFEIYVPEPKRRYGYYVLPFLLGDALVARVDLKADRKASSLLVAGAFLEPGFDRSEVVESLRAELATMASWLGLERVTIGSRGDLAPTLAGQRTG